MPVIATRPTFCAKALSEKPLKTAARAVEPVSARRPFATVSRSAGFPVISPRARMSAVASTMITSMQMTREMIALVSNCGVPKWKGVGT